MKKGIQLYCIIILNLKRLEILFLSAFPILVEIFLVVSLETAYY